VNKFICFRFDVDTHICLKHGVPNLIEVFKLEDARCTFFVSMGKAFKRSYFISEKLKINKSLETFNHNESLSMYSKLGMFNSAFTFFINPTIGSNQHKILSSIIKYGHELGLHGGRNHATWEKDSILWTEEQLRDEIGYGLKEFERQNLPKPISFASPCWKAPKNLDYILQDFNFKIVANQYNTYNHLIKCNNKISRFPTNVIGKNKEIGFIENLRALGYSTDEILSIFSNQLDVDEPFKMVFDHPFYAGIKEIQTIASMIRIAKEKGYIIESLKNIYQRLNNENTAHLS
jgi:hypothetical protein